MSIVVAAPHRIVPASAALHLARDEDCRGWLRQHCAEWDEAGVDLAQDAMLDALPDARGWRPSMPRGVMDMNRPFEVVGDGATLLGKPAVGASVRERLKPGATDELRQIYHRDFRRLRGVCDGATGLVEVHSYGTMGSSYDRLAGGRPVPRPPCAFVLGSPWMTSKPLGLARMVAPRVDAARWSVLARVGTALDEAGFTPGPSPYPTLHPWSVSGRFVAHRWFSWLGREGILPATTAETLIDRTWTDTRVLELDQIAAGSEEPEGFAGCRALMKRLGWEGDGLDLADRFAAEDPCFTVPVELRLDLTDRGTAFGEAIARALQS